MRKDFKRAMKAIIKKLGGPYIMIPRALITLKRKVINRVVTFLYGKSVGKFGKGSVLQSGIYFEDPSQVFIGNNCFIWRGVTVTSDFEAKPLVLEDKVQINQYSTIDVTGALTIGAGTLVSEHAFIYTHDHGLDPKSKPQAYDKVIGKKVWVGMRAIILAKCTSIGDHAVIGACSLITKDVPAGAIMGGIPAKILGWKEGYKPEDY